MAAFGGVGPLGPRSLSRVAQQRSWIALNGALWPGPKEAALGSSPAPGSSDLKPWQTRGSCIEWILAARLFWFETDVAVFDDFHFSIESEKMPERQVVRGLYCSRPAGLNSNQGGGDWYPQWSFCEPAFFRVTFLNLRANYPLSLHEVLELAMHVVDLQWRHLGLVR